MHRGMIATANLIDAQNMNTLQEIGMTNPIVAAYVNILQRHDSPPTNDVLIEMIATLAKNNEWLRAMITRKMETEIVPLAFAAPRPPTDGGKE